MGSDQAEALTLLQLARGWRDRFHKGAYRNYGAVLARAREVSQPGVCGRCSGASRAQYAQQQCAPAHIALTRGGAESDERSVVSVNSWGFTSGVPPWDSGLAVRPSAPFCSRNPYSVLCKPFVGQTNHSRARSLLCLHDSTSTSSTRTSPFQTGRASRWTMSIKRRWPSRKCLKNTDREMPPQLGSGQAGR
jgi:hypothetical protein